MCPVCGDPMVAFELEGVEIDRCLTCGGTWLDSGELEQIADAAGARSGKLTEALRGGQGSKHGKRRCVRCRSRLLLVRVQEVEVDHCAYGHGLWLDRGEMAGLVRSFHDGEEGAVARFFGDLFRAELPAKEEKGG